MKSVLAIVTGTTPALRTDAQILANYIRSISDCRIYSIDASNGFLRWRRAARSAHHALLGNSSPIVFMETAYRKWMRTSDCNILIPNLEWMYPESRFAIGGCNQVWCKSRDAEQRLQQRGIPTRYLGFTSRDRFDADALKDPEAFLHLAGRSPLKGTAAIVQAWLAHPHWPLLTIVARPDIVQPVPAPNVRFILGTISDHEVTELMNRCGVHLCPSEAEGFGHYIGEALSCASVVLTTNAPPMNEHFGEGEGVLLPYAKREPLQWGEKYIVSAEAIAMGVRVVLEMTVSQRRELGQRARERYLRSQSEFIERARLLVSSLP